MIGALSPRRPTSAGRRSTSRTAERRYSLLTARDRLTIAAMVAIPTLHPRPVRHHPDDRLDRPVVHELERHGRPGQDQVHRHRQLRRPRHGLQAVLPGADPQPDLADLLPVSWRRHSGSSSRSCSTRRSASRASTRARCTCRSSCRWPSSASSGSSSTPPSRGSSTTSSAAPHRATRSRGWATRTSTCGPSWWPRAGARSAT